MKESGESSHAGWLRWIVEAIHKIRQQKQRPSLERIGHTVKHQHPKADEACCEEHVQRAVKDGTLVKVVKKGVVSFVPPEAAALSNRHVVVSEDSDLTKELCRALREIGESPLKVIESHLRETNSVTVEDDVDLTTVLKAAMKRAMAKGLVVQEGRLYKALECKSPAVSPRKRRVSSPDREPPKVDLHALVDWALASCVDGTSHLAFKLFFSQCQIIFQILIVENEACCFFCWRLVVNNLLISYFLCFVIYEPEVQYFFKHNF